MSKTISATYSSQVTLSNSADNPVTLTGAAKLTPGSPHYAALYGYGDGTAWTITNSGVINAGTGGKGIQLGSGGNYVGASVIANASGGTIAGTDGISIYDSAASSIANQSGATISASLGHAVSLFHAGTITNSGVIIAPTANNTQGGVLMENGGVIINNTGGIISGYRGVLLNGPGTLTNSGTIKAATTNAPAVAFNGAGTNRMIVNRGAVFYGTVYGGGSGTLELKSAGSSAGTLTMTNFTGFNTVTLDASSIWTIIGSTTALSGAIQGFASNDMIDLTGFAAVSETFGSNKLILTNSSSSHATLSIQGSFSTATNFGLSSDGSGGTNIAFQALPPSITAAGTVSFTGGGSSTTLDGGLTVTDPGPDLAGATIAIASGFLAGDTLHFTNQNGITGSFNSATGTLTLSGTASVANYQTALASISYSFIPTSGDPTHAGGDTNRTITWLVSDGSAVSNTGTSKLQTTFAPVLAYGETIDEAGIVANSATVSAGVMTLLNSGVSVGTIAVGTSLSASGFTLAQHGTAGTDVIVSTVFGTYTAGVTLSVNPTTIAGTASISNGGTGPAVSGGTYTVVNYGKVTATGTGTSVGNPGIYLSGNGSTLDNRGIITASGNAAALYGTGSLINSGILSAGHWGLTSRGLFTVTNTGTISGASDGIDLFGGGFINNSNQIIGSNGLRITGATGAVINSGTIYATYGTAIDIASGGTVSNTGAGLISAGGLYAAITIAGGAGTVVNAGQIIADAVGVYLGAGGSVTNQSGGSIGGNTISGDGVLLAKGGSVTNQSGGTISGYYGVRASGALATVVNAGVIAGNDESNYQQADGVYLSAGGAVTNQAGGAIYGRNVGVLIKGGRGTVLNLGSIHSRVDASYGGPGISLDEGGIITNGTAGGTVSSAMIAGYNYAILFGATGTDTLINYGTVSGNPGTVAVSMTTGTVINGPSGAFGAQIISGLQSQAVLIGGVGTVVNYGTIGGAAANGEDHVTFGVSLGGDGTVASRITNTGAKALIYGYVAVYAVQNATVTNGGTIQATQVFGGTPPTTALIFGGGTNRLIINPGAVFIGNVSGSGAVTLTPGGSTTVLGTVNGIGTTTLELASAATAGTLSGLGTKYVGFAAVTIDSGANWTFSGSNTLTSGVTLADSGTLTDSGTFTNAGLVTGSAKGVVLAASARITNQSGGTIAGSSIGVSASGAGTVVNAGVIGGNQTVSSASGISFAAGGSVTNQSGGTIRGARAISEQTGTLTVLNAGSITGGSGASRSGIALNGSGTISNQSSGVITGNYGIVAYASGATITNAGSISGVYAVLVNAAGRLTNQSGGIISGSSEGVLFNAAATVTNAGTISGVGYGVQLAAGGTLIAQSGGTIGSAGTAVSFGAGRTNRLVVYQGASFTGRVDGGNTIGAASISSLELASSASAGTLTSLGSQFTHFARVTIDAGAQWVLGGTQSGFGTLTNAGSLGGTSGYGIKVGTSATGVTVVNQSGGVITGTTDAVFVITGSGAGTVSNSGKITGGATGFAGINLSGGGRVSNASGGTITGHAAGVFLANGSGATVTNAGSIGASQSYGVWLLNVGTVTNASGGVITGGYAAADAAGVYLGGGGAVTNQSGGTIGGLRGVYVLSSAATVVNAGRIFGSNTNLGAGAAETGAGVYLAAGGLVTNQSGGTISGFDGVYATNTAATVMNAGRILGNRTASGATGVTLAAGGTVTNQASGTINAANGVRISGANGTVLNLGYVNANFYNGPGGDGVNLSNGGTVINGASSGTVSAAYIRAFYSGVHFGATGTDTLINYGTVYAHSSPGVVLNTGTVINGLSGATGARIVANNNSAIQIATSGKVVNYGTITETRPPESGTVSGGVAIGRTRYYGVLLSNGGVINNFGSKSLIQGYVGVYGRGGVTVVNAGTIGSSYNNGVGNSTYYPSPAALQFGTGTNRLIVDPGAVFIGQVDGAGTTTGTATLELATGAASGALSGLGSQFAGFKNITIDAGATWSLSTVSLGAGSTINDAGTLTNASGTLKSAVTLGSAARLSIGSAGGISVSGTAVVASAGAATVVNAGKITGASAGSVGIYLAAGGLVSNSSGGTISGVADAVKFRAGYANRLAIAPGAVFTGTVDGGNTIGATSVSTLELASSASTGTLTGLGSKFIQFANISIDAGATWTLAPGTISAGYTINDAGTVTNTGTLNSAVTLSSGAQLTNATAGVISVSGTAVVAAAGTATVVNAGHITGASTGGVGVNLAAGGLVSNQSGGTIFGGHDGIDAVSATVVNYGSIASGATGRFGIFLAGNGTIVNGAGATIYGYEANVQVNGAGAVVTNLGIIADPSQIYSVAGVYLPSGGTIINGQAGTTLSTASISGHFYGVRFGYGGSASTLVNYGTIANPYGGKAVLMENGIVFNGRSGTSGTLMTSALLDAGSGAAVWFRGTGSTGTVVNYATISAHGYFRYQGVSLQGNGTVSNLGPSALIEGYIGVVGLQNDTVINFGTIASNRGSVPGALAVLFVDGTNRLTMYPGAKFIGTVSGGGGPVTLGPSGNVDPDNVIGSVTATPHSTLELASAGAAGTLSGLGTAFVNFANATIDHAAQWYLADSNTLGSGETLTNAGTLIDSGTFSNTGSIIGTFGSTFGGGTVAISVALGGILSNSATGAITGAAGSDSNVGAGGPGGHGVSLTMGSVINQGTVTGGGGGNSGSAGGGGIGGGGVVVGTGGLSNATSGLIIGGAGGRSDDDPPGGNGGAGVTVTGGSVTNAGTIIGGIAGQGSGAVANGIGGRGVDLIGGVILNQGTITGGGGAGFRASYASFSGYGVRVLGGTLVNAGVIGGGSGFNAGGTALIADAVFFGGAARMIVDPGASFVGLVAANTEARDVLELASSGSAGTIAGLGTSITNFASLVFDAGARWTVAGNASASGLGTLGIAGFGVGDTIDLTGFVAVSETFASNQLVLTDANTAHATLAIQGNLASSNFNIANGGAAGTDITFNLLYGQTVDEVGIVATSETVVAGVMTLSNNGSTVGTILVGNSLSTGDFSLAPDSLTTGTNVIVHTATGTYTSTVTLTVNPSTIGSSATIDVATYHASGVHGPSGTPWVLTNKGHISETGSRSSGIDFAGNGTIINAASATITATGQGILLFAGGYVSNQSGGTISGGVSGIMAQGAGALTLVNNGYLAGHDPIAGRGVMAAFPGVSITNQTSGTILGHVAIQTTGTSAAVYNAGSIGAEPTTQIGIYLKAGGTITNAASGVISGDTAIVVSGINNATVMNAGSIVGSPNAGGFGISLNTGGLISNQLGGVISGYDGIGAVATAVTVVNAGSIGGNSISGAGVVLGYGGTITNQSTGTISGGADAVTFAAGYTNLLVIDPGAVFTGTVDGGNTSGGASISTLELASGTSVGTLSGLGAKYIDFAQVTIDAAAAWTLGGTAAGFATLSNAGILASGVTLGAGSFTVSNQSSGTIVGPDGIYATAAASVVNAGSIDGNQSAGLGIYLKAGGSVINQSSGTITGYYHGIDVQGAAGVVINSGRIAGANGAIVSTAGVVSGLAGTISIPGVGVYLSSGGQVTNTTNGYIFGALIGVGLLTTGTVNNAGTIVGGTSGTTGYGVGLGDGGSVTNSATTAKILGARDGIIVMGTVGEVSNQGTIFGIQHYGINLLAGGSVTNSGTAAALAGIDDGAVIKNGAGSVTNEGTIAGIKYVGVYLGAGGGITNAGTVSFIFGATAGVVIGTGISGGIVTNAGTILAMGTAAAGVAFDDSASNTLINSGTILATGSAGIGLRFADGGNNTVIDSGTIIGGVTADAVLFADGNDLLELEPGASFIGGVDGGAGTNLVELAAGVGTLAGFNGVSITNFSSLVFDAGAAWTVSGNSLAGGLGALVINGFTSGDTIDLNGFTAISETFADNALVLTDRFTSHATLHFEGALNISNFAVSSSILATEISFHQPTTITAGGTVGFSGGGSPVILDGGVTVSDTSGATLAGATIAISSGFLTGDTLSFINQNGITASYDNATGILTLTGTASVLDYQAALASISYSLIPSNGDPTSGGGDTSRTITWVVNDGTTVSNIGTSSVSTTFAPVLTYGETIDETGIIAASQTVTAGLMILQNSATTVGTIAVGNSLSAGDFILKPDNATGTDIIVSTVFGSYASGVTLSVNPTTIASTAQIVGTLNNATGVYGQAGTAWVLTNEGRISEGPAFNGSFANSGYGISFAGSGTITNAAGGAIYGYSAGIKLSGAAARVVNLGRVGKFGDRIGVDLANGGVVINGQAGGTVSPAYIGGYSISALFASSNAGRLTNYGTISGNPHGTAIQMVTGTVVNGAGGATGALIGNGSASGVLISGAGTVVNHGTILGGGSFGQPQDYGVKLGGAGSIGNLGVASLIEGYVGVDAQLNATVTNAGTIASNYGASGTALRFDGGTNRLIVDPGAVFGGTVSAAGTTTLELASAGTVGTISALGARYINFSDGTVDAGAQWSLTGDNTWASGTTLTVSGTLSAAGTLRNHGAIVVDSPLIVTGQFINAGSVNATSGPAAVSVLSGGVANNIGIGVITGAVGTSLNVGAIGVAVAHGNLNNPAAIFGDGNGGDGGPGGSGVSVAGGSLTNHGTILGGAGGYSRINYGGAGGSGVDVSGSGIIINNQGTIIGGAGGTGSVSGAGGYGIRLQAGETLINSGLISGGGGLNGTAAAVYLASASRLIVGLGASFHGAVVAAAVNDVLELTGSGGGSLAGLGSSITGFNTLVFDDGAQWTIAGNDFASGLGTLDIYGFTVSDTIDLVGFAATSEAFEGNALVLSNASATATLHIQGDFNTSNFQIAPDQGTGTDISFLNAPSLIAGGTVIFTGGGAPVALDSGLLVTDQANATLVGATVSIASGFIAGDTLNFAPQSGITGSYDGAAGLLTLTGSATLADYQTALEDISYSFSPANGDPTGGGGDTSRTIHWLVNDGAAVSNTGTSNLATVHVAPTITAGGTAVFTGGGAPVVLDATLTVSDPDSGGNLTGATISVGSPFDTGDTMNFVDQSGIAGSYNNATGVLTLHGTATIEQYQTALASISFSVSPANSDPTGGGGDTGRTIHWLVNDGAAISNTGTSALSTVHVGPSITAGGTVTYAAGGAAAVLDPTVVVADPDSADQLTGGTVAVTGGQFSNDGGVLSAVVMGTAIAFTYNSATEVLTLSGTDTLADYQAVLRSVTFNSTIPDPTNAGANPVRTISWTVDDAVAVATTASSMLDVTLRTPAISGTVAGQATNDATALDPFAAVAVTDPNPGQTETVTITLSNLANGSFSSLGSGTVTGGAYVVSGTTLAVSSAIEALVFTPTAHQVAPGGSLTTGFTIAATDSFGVSVVDTTTTVVTTALNDPPVIAGTVAGQTVNDDATDQPFSLATISDPDFAAAETVTITLQASGLASDANGTLSGTGLTRTATGIYTLATGAPATVTTALEALVFTPTPHEVAPGGMVTTGMLLSVTDGIAGLPTTDSTTTVVTTAMPCFAAGTRIATPRGEVRVEELRVGDRVRTISGRLQPIEWIGRRSLDCRRHVAPRQIRPIRVAAHAFGENRPKRALLLSPDHSVFVRDVLIPIKFLVNGTTVLQINAAAVTYYHLALPGHDVVLADGLAAESYLETGGRSAFENNWAVVQIHPNFAPDEARAAVVWEAFGYAPLMGANGELDQVRARLAAQAVMLGYHADGMPSRRAGRRAAL